MWKAGGIWPECVTKCSTHVHDTDWPKYEWKGEWQKIERLRVDLRKSLCVGEKGRGGQMWNSLEFRNSLWKPIWLTQSRKPRKWGQGISRTWIANERRESILKWKRRVHKVSNESGVFKFDQTQKWLWITQERGKENGGNRQCIKHESEALIYLAVCI